MLKLQSISFRIDLFLFKTTVYCTTVTYDFRFSTFLYILSYDQHKSCFYEKSLSYMITMPPRKIPLFCLMHGHTENSAFGIRYDKKMTFDELRDAIFEKNKNAFENDNLDPLDLILYKVDIDTTTQSSQRTALGNPEADIVNDLGGL